MTWVKICGIQNAEQARSVAQLGVDYLGVNFWPGSKRMVSDANAREISEVTAQHRCQLVGLFVNQDPDYIEHCRSRFLLDWIQLHGDESPDTARRLGPQVVKAMPLMEPGDLAPLDLYDGIPLLVDSRSPQRGGTGRRANWELAAQVAARRESLWLAGGLGPGNVSEAISCVRPAVVDVASGVEGANGEKEIDLVAQFLQQVKASDES